MQHDVDIGVLGPVAVRGAAAPFRRSGALELVVYLAFHREGVRHAAWAQALWPDRPVCLSTVHSTASDARRALGRAHDGRPHLPRGPDLRLGVSVTTDVEQFAALGSSDDPLHLLEAMRLVRGPLFSGLRRTDWAVFDGTQSEVESSVVRTALRGADTFVQRGRGGEAEWIVRQALRVCPYDERLYRALLTATAAQGDRVRLRVAMRQLVILAGEAPRGPVRPAGPLPTEGLHPETTALYRDLLRRSPAAGGHPARL